MKKNSEKKKNLKGLIDAARGRIPGDVVIKNGLIADVYAGRWIQGDVALWGEYIAGIGTYEGKEVIDAEGQYLLPGFIDAHMHIESSFVSPEELGRLLVPHGTSTILADPHEIVNVWGLPGLEYMLRAAERTALDIIFLVPSCVPVSDFDSAGGVLESRDLIPLLRNSRIAGLGEFMRYPDVIQGRDSAIEKILAAQAAGKLIDGHGPGLTGKDLNAYISPGIHTDHECAEAEEMQERLSAGMYVLLRQGSACQDLENLLPGLTPQNSRRCAFCSDDRQAKTILETGHLEEHLRICVEKGIEPITAVQMATLNSAECFRLYDRGAIAPGLRADVVFVENLQDFPVNQVFIRGKLTAAKGRYLPSFTRQDDTPVRGSFHVKDFTLEKLRLPLAGGKARVIDIQPGSVVTKEKIIDVQRDPEGNFIFNPKQDAVKIAVIERHKRTGNVGLGLLGGYGLRQGGLALSIAHDSHNIIAVGVSDRDMHLAVETILALGGGVALVKDGAVLETLPLPLGGLMSDQTGEKVTEKLRSIQAIAQKTLGVNPKIEPLMTLCFMALPVIPKLKLTDKGLFDVELLSFVPVSPEA
ncbi:MAG: adenine deaminase [Spirochaetaceae bacterium]|jgi:adenine deaminase|nr:adenine deaminase [Spirochaetaceae bacterium]